jgi:hypothetical protein
MHDLKTIVQINADQEAKVALVNSIKHGDRVTILVPAGRGRDGQEWEQRTGRAVMRSSNGGWVINLGGAHGTPGLADDSNVVSVKAARQ